MLKCINYDCPIVKKYGQICTTLYIGDLTSLGKPKYISIEKIKPQHNIDTDTYTCYQFGD